MLPNVAPNCEGDSAGCCTAGGEPAAQLTPWARTNKTTSTNRMPNPELLWPQEAAELRSAWAAGAAVPTQPWTGEGARPHTSNTPSRSSGWPTMNPLGFDEALNGTRCSHG